MTFIMKVLSSKHNKQHGIKLMLKTADDTLMRRATSQRNALQIHTDIYFLTRLCSLLARFNIPDDDVVSRGRAEKNWTA